MGIPAGSFAPVAVAASVILINAALNIGIEAVCEGCAEEEKLRKKTLGIPESTHKNRKAV
jgi:hypothetical protein